MYKSNFEDIIKEFEMNGFDNIVNMLKTQTPYINNVAVLDNAIYKISNVTAVAGGIKDLKCDLIILINKEFGSKLENFSITDKLTGETSSLDCKGFDLSKASEEEVRDLLSGKKVELADGTGNKKPVSLSKSVSGWCLQVGKQVFSEMDSSSCL